MPYILTDLNTDIDYPAATLGHALALAKAKQMRFEVICWNDRRAGRQVAKGDFSVVLLTILKQAA